MSELVTGLDRTEETDGSIPVVILVIITVTLSVAITDERANRRAQNKREAQ
jgi:hypothetical protein